MMKAIGVWAALKVLEGVGLPELARILKAHRAVQNGLFRLVVVGTSGRLDTAHSQKEWDEWQAQVSPDYRGTFQPLR